MNSTDAARKDFWTKHMEQNCALFEGMERHPVRECGEGFSSIPDAMAEAGVEVIFSETKVGGKFDHMFFIRTGLIADLVCIARDMNQRGWILKIEDGYRTEQMQVSIGRNPAIFDQIVKMCVWENGGSLPPVELVYRRTKCLVALLPLNGTHLFGAAVDISVFRHDDGKEVWRGGPYTEMSERTPMVSPFVSRQELENRMEITRMMERHGFMHYPGEFWHYNKGDALAQILMQTGKPGIYGPVHWDPAANSVIPFSNPQEPLNSPAEFQRMVEEAILRVGTGGR